MKAILVPACLSVTIAMCGCASLKPGLGFDQVNHNVAERSGLRVQWDTGSAADEEAKAAVALLLKEELTAEKAMQVALLNNRDLQAVYEELHIAQSDLVQAGLLKNPVFNGDIRFATTGGPPAAELGIAQDFISMLSIPLRKGRAQTAFESEKLRVTGAVLDLAGEVRAAFYEAQASDQLREMRQTVLDATAASYELARRLREAGNIRDLDLSNERALHEQAKVDLASATSQLLADREQLNELMGLWGEQTQWKMAPRLPDIPAEGEHESDNLERQAVARSLDLEIAKKQIEIAARTLGITKATRLINEATIGFSAQREVSDNRGVQGERRREWYNLIGQDVTNRVEGKPWIWPPLPPNNAAHRYDGIWSLGPSVSIPIPLFDQGQAAVASDQSRLRQSIERYFALAIRLRARLRTIHLATEAARDKVAYYKHVIIPLRHKIVEEAQLQYNAMQVSAFQLLQAKRDEIGAGAEYVEELRNYWLAWAKLDLMLNGRMPPGSQSAHSMSDNGSHSEANHGGRNRDQ